MNGRRWQGALHALGSGALPGLISVVVLLLMCSSAGAQWGSGFEDPPYVGSPEGTIITGQDGFYIPVPDSQDGLVMTYADNAMGMPANPTGGDQFVASIGGDPALPVPYSRAQRDITYGSGTGVWTASFDIAATFMGELPTAQNLGSFSTQIFPNEATFIALARWTDPTTAANWNADYVWFNAGGTQLTESVPDPGFQNLATSHWYRWSTTFDLDTSAILEVAITDLTSGTTVTHNPVDRYLWGGEGGAPPPTGFRFFAGSGSVGGNALAWDNLDISTAAAAILGDLNCDGAVDDGDIGPFSLALVDPDGYAAAFPDCDAGLADIDGNDVTDGEDIDDFIACVLQGGCPSVCGDGTCDPDEDCASCEEDCGACVCGAPGTGDCCDPGGTGSPYCDDAVCCESVCSAFPECCDTEWDEVCATQASRDPNCECP